ncbi:hypothetical protein DFQ28_001625 [Apophysomyces sp. BC1034]|nr:hypothetical protein DFQ30_001960 [Apophysomyces sp. BC1015]KAG0180205.1 hypothetical protein DFQ29_001071 [Apophysomyces sp. BC1021]KAG0190737.1 hypothetical protein DFQ28_001625 [Apophysomyces sp. BC1034]
MFIKSVTRIVSTSARRFRSTKGGSEGATVSSKGAFSDKEKAVETQWAHLNDAEKIKHLHAELAKQKKVTDNLNKTVEDLSKSIGKK